MALLKGWNEGSLLKRTLVHVGALTFGAIAFVALLSFLLVTAAKAVFPSRAPKAAPSADAHEEKAESDSPKVPIPARLPKSRRAAKDAITEEENPNRAADR